MTAWQLACAGFIVCMGLMFLPSILQRRRHRRHQQALRAWLLEDLRHQLTHTAAQRDRAYQLYRDAVRVNAAYLEHITDERRAAAYEALTEAPLYFDTAARQSLAWLDETTWGEGS